MDVLPYEPDIANVASKSGTPRILKTDFGDGYNQRVDDGINCSDEEWSNLSWTSLSMANANILETFLMTHGAIAFSWTPPGESLQYFIVKSCSSTPLGNLGKRISATFKKVYDLI